MAFVPVPLCQGCCQGSDAKQGLENPNIKACDPKLAAPALQVLLLSSEVPTATGAVHRLGPTKGTAVAELRVNTDRTMEKPFKNYPG